MSLLERARAPRELPSGEATEERRLRVVDPAPDRLARRIVSFVVLAMVFAVLFLTVTFHVSLVTGQQKIDRLNRQADLAQQRYERLRIDVDRLSAPSRVVSRARSLGMVPAQDPIWLAPGSATTVVPDQGSGPSISDYLDVKPYLGDGG